MKAIPYIITALFFIAACQEEGVEHTLLLEDDFTITDDPNDPVQHERYNIYQEFGIPVYFNDTIAVRQTGTDWYGNPVMHYETVDLNWTFDSYNQTTTYTYDYLTLPDDQLNALAFTRQYLILCSSAMRPYSIMLADTLRVSASGNVEKPEYYIGFRTLVLSQAKNYTDSAMTAAAKNIIHSMIQTKVLANSTLTTKFRYVSAEKNWYNRLWNDLDCPTIKQWTGSAGKGFRLNNLFYGAPYNVTAQDYANRKFDFVDHVIAYGILTQEEAEAERVKMVQEMGNYGFICSSSSSIFTPKDEKEDIQLYLEAILYLGAEGFTERYGSAPLVLQKYQMLSEYMTNELGIEF